MQDFEKLGAFYLGKRTDGPAGALTDEIILYDSKDLTTHAVIIGMTGSGKTGLGIGLIEEAALDHIPVIAIDPKGDIGNLLLSFPQLRASDFEPWIDPRAATEAGQTIPEFAAATATQWKQGLADWGQTPARIAALRQAADFAIYTPGSSAGRPLSVLREFSAPPPELVADADLYRERVLGTVNSLMTLLGLDADPVASREHILISTILGNAWSQGRSLDLPRLIAAIQTPDFTRIGVMELDTFYPAKERFALAMRLNSLLASPGFESWMQGEPLDAGDLLYTPTGQPRVSVMSIAHLDDAQRMFFVTMLLGELIAWMRRQPGSASLRAVLYMDEIFGYMPPVAEPPSKPLLLTLLKQARAYGLGLVLATQNPVDLDYKGLSNAGTWFVGRLQTERDIARVSDGLMGASGSSNLDPRGLQATLAGLGKRRFLLHNVHEREPAIFQTRWAMAYLAGPLTREQIKRLSGDPLPPAANADVSAAAPREASAPADTGISEAPPVLPPGIRSVFLPADTAGSGTVYRPMLVAAAKLGYANARLGINEQRSVVLAADVVDGPVGVDWSDAATLDIAPDELSFEAEPGARFAACPSALAKPANYPIWERDLKRWLRIEKPLVIFRSDALKEHSRTDESERDFRIRLQQLANDARDLEVAKLRKRYDARIVRLEERLRRAQQAVEREAEQARGAKFDTAISFGTAVLGAVLGRKRVSVTSASRVSSAMRKAGSASKQAGDVRRARETVESIQTELEELQRAFDDEVAQLDAAYDAQADTLVETPIQAKSADVQITLLALGWAPATARG
jgi:hypothetical protein